MARTIFQPAAEGAFLVSAERNDGVTRWVRIKGLSGEPCRVRPPMSGALLLQSQRSITFKQVDIGIYDLDLKQGEELVLKVKLPGRKRHVALGRLLLNLASVIPRFANGVNVWRIHLNLANVGPTRRVDLRRKLTRFGAIDRGVNWN